MRMKRFRLILLSCVVVTSLLFSGTAYAQGDEELPNPGITPDSPFYFLDTWGKGIGLFLAFGPEAKARKALEYAEERLAEAHAMAVRERVRAVNGAANGYNEYLAIAVERMNEARNKGVDISEVSEITAVATSKHLLVLDGVMDIVPAEAQGTIAQAREASINGLGTTLRLLARENARRAIQINLAAIEGRLNRANDEADENNTEGVEDALDEFEVLSGFGREISEIAQGLGKDTTTVEQLVARATRHHLEVLALVYEKVPEEAQTAIEMAIGVSITGHQMAVAALEAKGALGDIQEEPPIPAGIPDEVKGKLKPGVLGNGEDEEEEGEGEAQDRGQGQRP